MSAAVASMANFGDLRGRDLYNRNVHQTVQASTAASALNVDHVFHGITASDGAAPNTAFELVKLSAIETAADAYSGRLDITVNDGSNGTAGVKVAELGPTSARFVAANLQADFATNYTATFAKSTGQDGVTASTGLVLAPGVGSTAVSLQATDNRLFVSAANTDLSGDLTVQGNDVNFYQSNAGTNKVSAAGAHYSYVHGTGSNSTNALDLRVDPLNVAGAQMASGEISLTTFNSTGATEKVLSVTGGAAAGAQSLNVTNAFVGINTPASAAYALDVGGKLHASGDTLISGNLTVTQDLTVQGTVTSINSTQVDIADKNLLLANNVTDPVLYNGGGISVGLDGSGNIAPTWTYSNAIPAWQANKSVNVITGMSYLVDGGANTTTDSGATLSASGVSFGVDSAALSFGTALTLNGTKLEFTDPNAIIYFGPAASPTATISSSGVSAAATYFGTLRQWRITRTVINGTVDTLSFDYCADGTVASPVYQTKFSISA